MKNCYCSLRDIKTEDAYLYVNLMVRQMRWLVSFPCDYPTVANLKSVFVSSSNLY